MRILKPFLSQQKKMAKNVILYHISVKSVGVLGQCGVKLMTHLCQINFHA